MNAEFKDELYQVRVYGKRQELISLARDFCERIIPGSSIDALVSDSAGPISISVPFTMTIEIGDSLLLSTNTNPAQKESVYNMIIMPKFIEAYANAKLGERNQ